MTYYHTNRHVATAKIRTRAMRMMIQITCMQLTAAREDRGLTFADIHHKIHKPEWSARHKKREGKHASDKKVEWQKVLITKLMSTNECGREEENFMRNMCANNKSGKRCGETIIKHNSTWRLSWFPLRMVIRWGYRSFKATNSWKEDKEKQCQHTSYSDQTILL